jgi:T-complex protein 1 subunit beta
MLMALRSTGEILVTNDGATILKAIALDNAAAKVLVNISKVQDDEVGDGTTSVTVLAAELLREAEKLVDRKIHPQTIIEGYRIASKAALAALEETAVDRTQDMETFRNDLHSIARTTLSSKVLSQDRGHFATLACDAVLRLKGSTDLSHIQVIKKAGGKLSDSYLDEGFILDKKIGVNQPKRLENAKILVANTPMDTDKVKIFGARVKVESTGKLAELEKAEREKMRAKVERIKAHGINCFVNRQLIYNWPEQLFTEAGMVSIEHADFDGIERLALVTGGEITSTFENPEQVQLGHCDSIEEVIIGEDTLIKFGGTAAGQACTIVLRGATEQLLDEAERSLHDALAVLSQTVKDPRVALGGGSAEMVMSKAAEQAAQNTTGKKQMAVDSFAHALKQLPTILADNAGLDSSDLVTRLRQAINSGATSSGLDLLTPGGGIGDMREMGVVESYRLKRAVVSSASEAAEVRFLGGLYGSMANGVCSCFFGWTISSARHPVDGRGCKLLGTGVHCSGFGEGGENGFNHREKQESTRSFHCTGCGRCRPIVVRASTTTDCRIGKPCLGPGRRNMSGPGNAQVYSGRIKHIIT